MTFLFELDHSVQPMLRTDTAENPSEFAMLRDLRLHKQAHFFLVNPTREENFRHFKCILPDFLVVADVVVIIAKCSCQRMIVCNHEILLGEVRALLKFEHVGY